MTYTHVLRKMQEDAGAVFVPVGSDSTASDAVAATATEAEKARAAHRAALRDSLADLVATFGAYEAEYAMIRKGVGILHLPQRGILRFTGNDRRDFLHRMTTQDINAMAGGSTRRAFQLNDKGRIIADITVHHGDIDTWLEMDSADIAGVRKLFESRLFSEDVVIEDITATRTAIALHGPSSIQLLQSLGATRAADVAAMANTHHVIESCGQHITAYRRDDTGALGVHLLIPTDGASEVYAALANAVGGLVPGDERGVEPKRALRGRAIGWLAFNTARIEAGSPLYHIDFGPDSLPAEASLLDQTVSFKKGCYLGQEIVARMQNLGHPKRVLAGLKFNDDRMPIQGAQVLDVAEDGQSTGAVIGAVTSSTVAPMLSQTAIGLAVMKWGKHRAGTKVVVPAEGVMVPAVVQGLRFIE